jgi:hypothetical protein
MSVFYIVFYKKDRTEDIRLKVGTVIFISETDIFAFNREEYVPLIENMPEKPHNYEMETNSNKRMAEFMAKYGGHYIESLDNYSPLTTKSIYNAHYTPTQIAENKSVQNIRDIALTRMIRRIYGKIDKAGDYTALVDYGLIKNAPEELVEHTAGNYIVKIFHEEVMTHLPDLDVIYMKLIALLLAHTARIICVKSSCILYVGKYIRRPILTWKSYVMEGDIIILSAIKNLRKGFMEVEEGKILQYSPEDPTFHGCCLKDVKKVIGLFPEPYKSQYSKFANGIDTESPIMPVIQILKKFHSKDDFM